MLWILLVSVSIVFEIYGLEYTRECDDGLIGYMVVGLLREYQIIHGAAEIQARLKHGTQDSRQNMAQYHFGSPSYLEVKKDVS